MSVRYIARKTMDDGKVPMRSATPVLLVVGVLLLVAAVIFAFCSELG